MKNKYNSPKLIVTEVALENEIVVSSEYNIYYYIESFSGSNVNNLEFFDYEQKVSGENDIYL